MTSSCCCWSSFSFPFHCMQSPSSAEDEILFVFGGWPLNPDRSLASGEKWSNITTTCFRFTTFSSSRCMSSRCRDWFLSEEMAVSIKRRIWTPNRRELKLWEVVLVLTVVARFGGKINKSTHRGRDWGLTRHSCKIHHWIQEKHVKPSLWKDQVERHQLAGSVCQLVSVRTIGGNEDKTIGTFPLTYRSSSTCLIRNFNIWFTSPYSSKPLFFLLQKWRTPAQNNWTQIQNISIRMNFPLVVARSHQLDPLWSAHW